MFISSPWLYTHDANGMRIGRSNGTKTYSYLYTNGLLSRMILGDDTLCFAYDAVGAPLTVNYNGTTFYYVTNLQGDVIAILDRTGYPVVQYTYNAWGELLSATGPMLSSLGALNPLLYRGYVYDRETGLYYLQSRYYNPEIGRFISADNLVGSGAGFVGYNQFAYCTNNPIIYADSSGHWIETVFDLFSLGVSVVEVVINPLDPWAWAGLAGDALDLIPIVTGLGESIKGMKVVAKGADKVEDALTTIRFAKAASYADEFAEGGLDLAKALNRTSDGFTISNRLDGVKIHKSFMENGSLIPGTRLRADGLDTVAKSLYELKPYNRNNLRKGLKQILNYNDKLGGGYQMILVFY